MPNQASKPNHDLAKLLDSLKQIVGSDHVLIESASNDLVQYVRDWRGRERGVALAVVRQARNYEQARRMLGLVEAENPLRLEDEITAGQDSGGFTGGPSGWSWVRIIEDFGAEDEEQEGLFQVTTRVYWSQSGDRRGMEETVQMLYVPENVDGKRTLKPKAL